LKIIKSPYLNEKSCDFDEIWYTTADLELDDNYVSNMKIFKIEHGRWPSYCKWFFLAITQHLMSNFSEILHREAVIHRISAIGQL